MSRETYYLFALTILLSTLSFAGWFWGGHNFTAYHMDAEALAHSIDFSATEVTFDEFDVTGQLTRHLETSRVDHIPFQNHFILENPRITFQLQGADQWYLRANHANSFNGFERVTFEDQVYLLQTRADKKPGASLETKTLVYFPKRALLWTQQSVLLKQPPHTMTSEGMHVNLKNNHVQLHHMHLEVQSKKSVSGYTS